MKNEITRESVVEMLRKGVVNVKFTKKNGEVRDMKCTLIQSSIPQDKQAKGVLGRVDESVVRVYDIATDGWRSFVLANVLSVQPE